MKKYLLNPQVFIAIFLGITGCSDEQDYRNSMLQQFADNASGLLQIQGISSLSGLITDDMQSAGLTTENTEYSHQEFAAKTYQILDDIFPKKSEIFDSDKGLLTYVIDLSTVWEKIPGALGKHMETLCVDSEHIATVKVREMTQESPTPVEINQEVSKKFNVSIEVTCQEDDQPSFTTLATFHNTKMRWQQGSNQSLLHVFQNAIQQTQPSLSVRLENTTHTQMTDTNTQETKFILGEWVPNFTQKINMQVSWGFGVEQSGSGIVNMQSDEILKQLTNLRNNKPITNPVIASSSKHSLSRQNRSLALTSTRNYGPNPNPYGRYFPTTLNTQNNETTDDPDDKIDEIDSLKEEIKLLDKQIERQKKINLFIINVKTKTTGTNLANENRTALIDKLSAISTFALRLPGGQQERIRFRALTNQLLMASGNISMKRWGRTRRINQQREDLQNFITIAVQTLKRHLYG